MKAGYLLLFYIMKLPILLIFRLLFRYAEVSGTLLEKMEANTFVTGKVILFRQGQRIIRMFLRNRILRKVF